MADQPEPARSFQNDTRVGRGGGATASSVEVVYRREHEKLWRSLYAFVGDRDLASEAAAETVSQALGRGDQLNDPAAWIWRTAFKVASGLLADRARQSPLSSPEMAALAEPDERDPSLLQFLDLLGSLSEQQRAIVTLRYASGFMPREIAVLLDTSANTVRVQLHRAQTHLRERIEFDDR